ncbi:MAG: hypothetical protein IPP78_08895 [Holophagaceae bacterium]|nr:hypothetical protein [Holophagaceae bacterium]
MKSTINKAFAVGLGTKQQSQQFEQQREQGHKADNQPERQAGGIAEAVVVVEFLTNIPSESAYPA